MKHLSLAFALVLVVGWPATAQQLLLQIQDGRVTLEASGVPARQILAEWATVGGTKVVGAEKMVGPPLTLKLVGTPERQALDIILGSVAGFMAAERQASAAPGASAYDRILILATSSPPVQAVNATRPGTQPAPANNAIAGTQRRVLRPPNMPASPAENEADADREAEEEQAAANPNPPVFTFPAPGAPNNTNPVFVPMNGGNNPFSGSPQPGFAQTPVITLQPNANGQPTIYNFVPNVGGTPTQTTPATGFGVVGAPMPGMIQQLPAPVPPPGQQRPPK